MLDLSISFIEWITKCDIRLFKIRTYVMFQKMTTLVTSTTIIETSLTKNSDSSEDTETVGNQSDQWTTEISNDFLISCENTAGMTHDSRESALYCACMLREVKKRWTPQQAADQASTVLATLTNNGILRMRADQAGIMTWTVQNKNAIIYNCTLAAMNTHYKPTFKVATDYCTCVINEVSNRWNYEQFIQNELEITQALVEDGTIKRCIDSAKIGL